MGWAYCGTDYYGREIGYGIEATCDQRGCNEGINRGLGYLCGDMHHGPFDDERGCGRYYCGNHIGWVGDRGSCTHRRGYKAWGETKCQLLAKDVEVDLWFDKESRKWKHVGGQQFYCACHEWEIGAVLLSSPVNKYVDPLSDKNNPLNNWKFFPSFVAHVEARGFASEMRVSEDADELTRAGIS